MDKMREIVQAKQLRGEITSRLYHFYGDAVALKTIKNLIGYKEYYPQEEMKRAICYLSGHEKAYILIEINKDDYWDSMVQLTPRGVNLAEGDIKDMGVLINE